MATSSSSSYTVSGGKTTAEADLIPYTTDTIMEKTDSLPKLITLEHRPPSQCSSPTSSGEYWPLIGVDRSRDLNTGLGLAD